MELLAAAVLSCAVNLACDVGPGTCRVSAVVWYQHEALNGDPFYSFDTTDVLIPSTPGMMYTADVSPGGAPIGIVWTQAGTGRIIRQCGVNPTEVFRDGFESGNTSAWR